MWPHAVDYHPNCNAGLHVQYRWLAVVVVTLGCMQAFFYFFLILIPIYHRKNAHRIRHRIYTVLATKTGQTRKTVRTYAAPSKYRNETNFDGPKQRPPSKYPFNAVCVRLFSSFMPWSAPCFYTEPLFWPSSSQGRSTYRSPSLSSRACMRDIGTRALFFFSRCDFFFFF